MSEFPPDPAGIWTTESNARRVELIRKMGSRTPEEENEFEALQQGVRGYVDRVCPYEEFDGHRTLLVKLLQGKIDDRTATQTDIRMHELTGKALDGSIVEQEQDELNQLLAQPRSSATTQTADQKPSRPEPLIDDPEGIWTTQKEQRLYDLYDAFLYEEITPEETEELVGLEKECSDYYTRVDPDKSFRKAQIHNVLDSLGE